MSNASRFEMRQGDFFIVSKAKKYDPQQARGPKGSPEGGQWVKGVSPERRKNPAGRIITHGPESTPAVGGRTFTSEEGFQWHEKGPVAEWAKQLPYADYRVIDNYSGFGYREINNLRRGEPPTRDKKIRAMTPEEIDAVKKARNAEYDEGKKKPDPIPPEGPKYHYDWAYEYARDTPSGPEKLAAHWAVIGPKVDEERLAIVTKQADQLDDMFAHRGYVLPEAITVERGAYIPGITFQQLQDMAYEGPNGEPPAIWEEKGFTSTMVGDAQGRATSYPALGKTESLYQRWPSKEMYNHQDEVGEAIRFHITLPAGTKVASVESVRRLSHDFPDVPKPLPEGLKDDPYWKDHADEWKERDYTATPKTNASDLEKGKDGRRTESELLLGSGARFRVVKVQPGEMYKFYDPQIHDIPIREVYLEYIGGGSSDGRNS